MKIVWMLGGLANQMFQYAFYRVLRERFQDVKLDISEFAQYSLHNGYELTRIFGVHPDFASQYEIERLADKRRGLLPKLRRRLLGKKETYFIEDISRYYPEVLERPGDIYLQGYWQNEGYFKNIDREIRKEFQFPRLEAVQNLRILEQIQGTESVSIHVRRGDYVNHPLLGGICDSAYYQKAIEEICLRVCSPKFFVFSDDINYCKEQFSSLTDVHYIDWNQGEKSYIDMQLMSCCSHNIIANSTFSWWGAWLNQNPAKIVVAPNTWFREAKINRGKIIPKGWLTLTGGENGESGYTGRRAGNPD